MTFPPICGPLAAGAGSGPQAPTLPSTFPPDCGAFGQAQPAQQVGGRWTATGTVVEPRCFFPTQSGDTCPRNWCGMIPTFDSIRCYPRTLFSPDCIQQVTRQQVGFAGGGGGYGGGYGGGFGGGPTPTATFPPVCGDPGPAQAAQMPTIYPQYTCGFVCNTQFPPCGHPQELAGGGGGGQVGAAWTAATCLEPRCFFPTQSGDTCPRHWCNILPTFDRIFCAPQTMAGHTCPRGWCNPWPMRQQQQQQIGAFAGGTLVSPRCLRTINIEICQPTTRGDTCPPTLCTIYGLGCPARPQFAQVGAGEVGTLSGITCPRTSCDQPIRTIVGLTCPSNICQVRTAVGATCPLNVCFPTVIGITCPQQWCIGVPDPMTMTGRTCPAQLCDPGGGGGFGGFVGGPQVPPTEVAPTCPQWQCQPTLGGATCPWQFCQPTLNPQCVFEPGPVIPQPDPQQAGAGPVTIVGATCPYFLCQPTFNLCPPQY